MLHHVDLDVALKKDEYSQLMPELALALRELQWKARKSGLPVMLVFEGWDGAGIGDAFNKLGEALDPRHLETHAIFDPTQEELYYPFLWRFWKKTPAEGEMAMFDRSWNQTPVRGRVSEQVSVVETRRLYRDIVEFERKLVDGGTLIIKIFLHISQKEQRKRFRKFRDDPYDHWRVTRERWAALKKYPQLLEAFTHMLENTSTAEAPWDVIAADHRHYRRVKIFQHVIERLEEGIERHEERKARRKEPATREHPLSPEQHAILSRVPTVLDRVDLSLDLEDAEYKERLKTAQVRLRELLFSCYDHRIPVSVAFEGWDAAGKGGCIKRLVARLDPRSYHVKAVQAPTQDELRHHYLWRFWRDLPKAGHLQIYDRSWYGRVLVERVEGFATEQQWKGAYREINEFERHLTDYGMVVAKFWLQISNEEQLRRFEARKESPFKNYKLTDEDYRNREKWHHYLDAVREMLERTSTTYAPWTIVENEHKRWGRVKVIETLNREIEAELEAHKARAARQPAKRRKK